ncbi:glycoside hydrolase family 3 N-terminal domain-containing protein [Streptomyces sp. NPDC046716]|uniref:glycoside hydrolase family 3 protein n=1 Tax=Streptomyces sp. NPDC046716 TaxID=3157093 RepID=UPI0033E46390
MNHPTTPYLDPELPVERRVEDLLSRMTLEEKAGQLFHTANTLAPGGQLLAEPDAANGVRTAHELVVGRHITHFNLLNGTDPYEIALWHNRLQELAADTRLGIPVTVSTDPRHGMFSSPAAGQAIERMSRWPEHTGIGAIGDARLAEEYGDVVRREYTALGIRVALGPMADLFTDPRWSRGYGTFGEDPVTVANMTAAFIRGLRGGDALGADSVAAMVKHFPGGGPQLGGEDAHDPAHREQVYPGGLARLHELPFDAAFRAGATQVMTYYGMPLAVPGWEEVGFAFNRPVVTDLLRGHYGFDGIVCTDWNVIESTMLAGDVFDAHAYGLENLTPAQRLARALDAGVDQFGGDDCTELVVELVRGGAVSEARIDVSVRRLLREKFRLGLFERRRVDAEAAAETVGSAPLREAGRRAQRRSLVLVKNADALLPLSDGTGLRVYAEGLDPEQVAAYGTPVADVADAEVAVVRLRAPFEDRGTALSEWFHGGSLDFPEAVVEHVGALAARVPTVVLVYLERPAVLTEIAGAATAVVGDFGAEDDALLDLVFGRCAPEGRLPFDLPSSMKAVGESREDVPFDTRSPLHRFGHHLSY